MIPSFLDRLFEKFNSAAASELTRINLEPPRNWSEQYPDTPKHEPKLSIHLIAAQWACHDLHGEDMPGIAADLLEAGLDSPGLRRLAAESEAASTADVAGLVARALRDFGIPHPLPEDQAQLILARQIARQVIAGDRVPSNAANYIEQILWGRRPTNEYLAMLLYLNDEREWDTEYQRFMPAMTVDLMDAFARLAEMSDVQIFAAKHEQSSPTDTPQE
jgi:hypothetical protein